MTVHDGDNAQDQVTRQVNVTAANQPPVPDFSFTADHLTVDFDASASSDPDGSIDSYAWNFGDGESGTGVTPDHTYGSAGVYDVRLTVTDSSGATQVADQVGHCGRRRGGPGHLQPQCQRRLGRRRHRRALDDRPARPRFDVSGGGAAW